MNLKDILAISGYPGLFKLVSQAKNGIIVESLIDKRRFPAFSTHKVSVLDDVAIFTRDGEIPLKQVFLKILEKENGGPAINYKSSTAEEMKSYFTEILPEYDEEKVYMSDIKKVLMWYNTLHQVDMLNLPEEEKDEKDEKAAAAEKEEKPVKDKKPGKEKEQEQAVRKKSVKK